MSYILDALKKADSQRDRAAVPGIGTHQAVLPPEQASPGSRPLLWVGGIAALALAGAAAWRIASPPAPPVIVVQAPPAPAPAPVPAPVPAPAPIAAASATAPEPVPVPVPKAAAPARAVPSREAATAPEPGPRAKAPAKVPAEEAAEPIVSIAQLPSEVRREIPALTITGSTYSENPALRMLIINGQVVNEGGAAAPGLVLERIRPGTAVLLFRGTRFSMAY